MIGQRCILLPLSVTTRTVPVHVTLAVSEMTATAETATATSTGRGILSTRMDAVALSRHNPALGYLLSTGCIVSVGGDSGESHSAAPIFVPGKGDGDGASACPHTADGLCFCRAAPRVWRDSIDASQRGRLDYLSLLTRVV
jgi:hypothetical protein